MGLTLVAVPLPLSQPLWNQRRLISCHAVLGPSYARRQPFRPPACVNPCCTINRRCLSQPSFLQLSLPTNRYLRPSFCSGVLPAINHPSPPFFNFACQHLMSSKLICSGASLPVETSTPLICKLLLPTTTSKQGFVVRAIIVNCCILQNLCSSEE